MRAHEVTPLLDLGGTFHDDGMSFNINKIRGNLQINPSKSSRSVGPDQMAQISYKTESSQVSLNIPVGHIRHVH